MTSLDPDDVDFAAFLGQSNAARHFWRHPEDTSPGVLGFQAFEAAAERETGQQMTAINGARGDTSSFPLETKVYWWDLGGARPGPALREAVAKIDAALGPDGDLDVIVWAQGETDAAAIAGDNSNAAAIAAAHKAALMATFEYLWERYGDVPVLIQEIADLPEPEGSWLSDPPGAIDTIRAAQTELIEEHPLVHLGATPDPAKLHDAVHLTVNEYQRLGQELARVAVREIEALATTQAGRSIVGTQGADNLAGTIGKDTISGANGNDQLRGGSGNDVLIGGDGNDFLNGNKGDDVIFDGAGRDAVFGGPGDDRLVALDGLLSDGDRWTGGAGIDTLDFRASTVGGGPIRFDLEDGTVAFSGDVEFFRGIERLIGSEGGDFITGSANDDWVSGAAGRDLISGHDGEDTLRGGAGDDVVYAGRGADLILGGDGKDELFGHAGSDRLYGEAGDDALRGDAGDDEIRGGSGSDTLHGGAGNDLVEGDGGNDSLIGGWGNDLMRGGGGFDVLRGGGGNDQIGGGDKGDTVIGGAGSDSMVGGRGHDLFLFEENDLRAGERDHLVDFWALADTVVVEGAPVIQSIARVGAATLVTYDNAYEILFYSTDVAVVQALADNGDLGILAP